MDLITIDVEPLERSNNVKLLEFALLARTIQLFQHPDSTTEYKDELVRKVRELVQQ